MPLSDQYTVWSSHSKWLSEWSNKSASNFALSLNIFPRKLFRWFRRLQLWATGDWQLHHDNIFAHTSRLIKSFLVKHQITQVTQPPYSPDLAPCHFWLFPKLKSPLKRKRFQTISKIQENKTGIWWWLGELCEVPTCLLWRGLRHHCPMYNVPCIFCNKCLFFSYYMAGYLLDRPCILKHTLDKAIWNIINESSNL